MVARLLYSETPNQLHPQVVQVVMAVFDGSPTPVSLVLWGILQLMLVFQIVAEVNTSSISHFYMHNIWYQ